MKHCLSAAWYVFSLKGCGSDLNQAEAEEMELSGAFDREGRVISLVRLCSPGMVLVF